MSYRSVKRVLGETSLERKCRFLFGACLLLLITASFWWYGERTVDVINEQNRNTGRLLAGVDMLVRHWRTLESKGESKGPENWGDAAKQLSASFSQQPYEAFYILPNPPKPVPGESVDYGPPEDNTEAEILQTLLNKKRPSKPMAIDENEYRAHVRRRQQVLLLPGHSRQR